MTVTAESVGAITALILAVLAFPLFHHFLGQRVLRPVRVRAKPMASHRARRRPTD